MGRIASAATARAVLSAVIIACAAWPSTTPARAGAASPCTGDCADDGTVTIDDLILGVSIALGEQPLSACTAFDRSGDGQVTVDELISAVNAALGECVETPTATPTGTAAATATVPPTATATAPPTAPDTPTLTPTPTVTTTPIGNPSDLTAVVDGELVRLRWTLPDPASGNTSVIVLRRLNAAVEGPDDPAAAQIFFGPASAAVDELAALLPDLASTPRTYSYAVYGCSGPTICERTGSATTLAPTLVQALRAGGYTLFWRHADADRCADNTSLGTAETTTTPNWWKSCDADCGTATARQLNEAGVMHATAIGQAFDALAIPVGRVVSSEYCRCFTTAALMDFGPDVEQDQGISFFVYDEINRCEHSYALIDTAPAVGTNTAIIGHAGFSPTCDVLSSLAWSEVAIFKPDGQGGSTFITRLTWDAWAPLVEAGPTGLVALVDSGVIRLSWNAPDPSSGYTRVRALRRLNAAVAGPNDAQATMVYSGTGTDADDALTALLPDTPDTPRTYHYAVYGCAGATCESVGSTTTVAPTLVQALRAGGYVIHWRHADADRCSDNQSLGTAATTMTPNWWKSCVDDCSAATARQLNDTGRMRATAIGQAIDERGIPIGQVLSSEYCRCVTTAELMDFGPAIEQLPDITYYVYDEPLRCAHSYERIAEVPSPGTNSAIIGHAGFATDCAVIGNLQWSEAAVFKPDGAGGSTFIAQVAWDQWATLP